MKRSMYFDDTGKLTVDTKRLTAYNAVEFITSSDIRVCFIQADSEDDALVLARMIQARAKDSANVDLLPMDTWMSKHGYSEHSDRQTYEIFYSVMNSMELYEANIANRRVIVYGNAVKYIFAHFKYEWRHMPITFAFLNESAIILINYHDDNILSKLMAWYRRDIYEQRMRDVIDFGKYVQLVNAEHEMDCLRG